MAYRLEERETHLYFDPIYKEWRAWTNIMSWRDKLIRKGWTLMSTSYEKGAEVDWTFSAPKNAITVRDLHKVKNPAKYGGYGDEDNEDYTFILEE